ncbi:hypothetical protein MCOR02_000080 [Pyricularia oryzae]|nr:hypothetical protein MCOR02_000080 [Pyricularia oryzae]
MWHGLRVGKDALVETEIDLRYSDQDDRVRECTIKVPRDVGGAPGSVVALEEPWQQFFSLFDMITGAVCEMNA